MSRKQSCFSLRAGLGQTAAALLRCGSFPFGLSLLHRLHHSLPLGDIVSDLTLTRFRSGPVESARRTAITYPGGRRIDLGYGASGGASDRLSRVETVQIQGEAQTAAAYTFVGALR